MPIFIFPHYKSMATYIATRVLIRLGQKTILFRIGLMASEEMSFENVDDDGRTTDAWLYYGLTYETSAQVS